MNTTDSQRYLANWQDEINSAALYRAIADVEGSDKLAQVYRQLADQEEKHATFWEGKLRDAGRAVPARKIGWRTKVMTLLARYMGASFVLPTLNSQEQAHGVSYDDQPEAAGTALPAEERSHARILQSIAGGMEGSDIAQLEGRHRASRGNALRAAVLGANDGLLSNFSLVMGVAGAQLNGTAILITGLAGLLAGAGSMAMGEWVSVQSSRELYTRQIQVEAMELEEFPEEETEEIALIYQAKGMPEKDARSMATRLMKDRASALDTLSKEELGIDPKELGGSAWEASISSFVLFALGAIVPVAPFLFLSGIAAVITSAVASALALFGIGALITILTGKSVLFSGGRQVLIGGAAAALTYLLGTLLDVAISSR